MRRADAAAHDSAFQGAYKAIEAVIGDPNKNDAKFHQQLRTAGLDPTTRVGYGNKGPLAERIRELGKIRDKRTGHGTRPRKAPLTKGELIEVQQCGIRQEGQILAIQTARIIPEGTLVKSFDRTLNPTGLPRTSKDMNGLDIPLRAT